MTLERQFLTATVVLTYMSAVSNLFKKNEGRQIAWKRSYRFQIKTPCHLSIRVRKSVANSTKPTVSKSPSASSAASSVASMSTMKSSLSQVGRKTTACQMQTYSLQPPEKKPGITQTWSNMQNPPTSRHCMLGRRQVLLGNACSMLVVVGRAKGLQDKQM